MFYEVTLVLLFLIIYMYIYVYIYVYLYIYIAILLDLFSSVGRVIVQYSKGPGFESHELPMYLCCYYAHVFTVVYFVLTYVYMLGGNWT